MRITPAEYRDRREQLMVKIGGGTAIFRSAPMAVMNWMNKEDRKLLKELNQRIAHNPRLFAQRLAMQAKFLQKQRLLQAGLAGFIFGVFLTATGFCALNLTAAEKETTSSRTPVSESAPKLTPASERDS